MQSIFTYLPYPHTENQHTIPQLFTRNAERYPENIAVSSINRTLTYGQLHQASNRLANAIIKLLGPEAEPVGLICGHDVEQYIGMLGIMKSGKFYVPLATTSPKSRNASILQDTGARLVVADKNHLYIAKSLPVSVMLIDCEGESDNDPPIANSPLSYAFIIYTSGSTGKPKGVVWRHRDFLHFALTKSAIGVTPVDRVLALSKYHFSGSLGQTYSALTHGASLYIYDVAVNGLANLASYITKNQITIFQSVPTLFRHFMHTLQSGERLFSVRAVRIGGEPARWTDVTLFKQHFKDGCILRNGYGLTEIKYVSAFYLNHNSVIGTGSIPVGYPAEDIEIYILGDRGEILPCQEIGEIAVVSPYMSSGYWHRPELTEQKYHNVGGGTDLKMYITGDMGYLQDDGCLVHLGRNDRQVKINGQRVELMDVEAAILSHQSILDTVVTAAKDHAGDLRLVAYIVPQNLPCPSTRELRAYLIHVLPPSLIPSLFICMPEFPVTQTGKTNRNVLPEPTWDLPLHSDEFVAPESELERRLALLWKEILGIKQVGITDNFFELGGDSIKISQFLNSLNTDCSQELLLQSFFEDGTISGLASILAADSDF